MKVKEILDRISSADVRNAFKSFESLSRTRKEGDSKYILIFENKEYPVREIIMRASNFALKQADNSNSFTSNSAKQKLIELGFTKFKNESKSFKYYIKKVSKQDVGKTTVVNQDAISSFFCINLTKRNDSKTISLKYLSDDKVDKKVVIRRKQDSRIFLERSRFKQGDLLISENLGGGNFSLDILNSYSSKYRGYNEILKDNFLLTNNLELNINGKQLALDIKNEYMINSKNMHLNQIFYGPPGTGKTDATIENALDILELKTSNREENREIFRSLLNKRIFFVTMHPSYSYEDFVQGYKPVTSDDHKLTFKSKSGIFKTVSDLATKIFENEGEVIDNDVDNKDILRICYFLSKFNSKSDKKANSYFGSESNGEVFAKVGNKLGANPNSIKNHRDKFDYVTTEDRKGWQPRNGKSAELDNSQVWPYQDIYLELKDMTYEQVLKIVKSIEEKISIEVKRVIENINYVLILDEINRANISKVFGELISLIEEDKRIGNENELTIKLPSGDDFAVPPNLYIIGTMNTADKSIALVDLALRRRFQFIPFYPNSTVIENFCKSEDKLEKAIFMDSLNTKLRVEKGVDFQIGHAYFLKSNSLGDVINENIIPLLVEYMRNDLEKVKKIFADLGKPLDEEFYRNTGLLKFIG